MLDTQNCVISGEREPKLLRGPAESHTPQDFPSFATETSYVFLLILPLI